MNIGITKEEDSPLQQKQDGNTKDGKINNKASASTSSPWLRLKDPRIVRVSRAFGGKDRHSKVCTIRGLRDRRVRLSVPTAIQLYDLQDRLGLNQPSKVVDWLLNAAKQEIDELPPLPVSPMNFTLNHHEIAANSLSAKQGFKISNWGDLERQDFWSNESLSRAKVERDTTTDEKKNWMKRTEKDDQHDQRNEVRYDHRGNSHSDCSSSGLMNNSTIAPYGSYFQLDHHPSFPSSHLAGFVSQTTTDHDLHMPTSALSLSSGSQFFAPQNYFPAVHNFGASADTDPRQINQFQMFCSNTRNLFSNSLTNTSNPYSMNDQSSASSRGFHFNVAPRLFNSNSTEGSQEAKKDLDFLRK